MSRAAFSVSGSRAAGKTFAHQRPAAMMLLSEKYSAVVPASSPRFTYQPCSDGTRALGNAQCVAWTSCMSTIVMVGALLTVIPVLTIESIEKTLQDHLPERHKKLLPLNFQALRAGAEFVRKEQIGQQA